MFACCQQPDQQAEFNVATEAIEIDNPLLAPTADTALFEAHYAKLGLNVADHLIRDWHTPPEHNPTSEHLHSMRVMQFNMLAEGLSAAPDATP